MSGTATVKGYRELSQPEIDLINEIKTLAQQVGELVTKVGGLSVPVDHNLPDLRWVAIGKTHLQQGFMALVRSIAQPTTF